MFMHLLLLAGQLTFGGGNVHKLAATISAQEKRPSFVMRGNDATIKAFEIEPSDDHLYRHMLKFHTGLEQGPNRIGYGPAGWPDYFIVNRSGDKPNEMWVPKDQEPPETAITQDKSLSLKLGPSGNFRVGDLKQTEVGEYFSIHWLYEKAIVSPSSSKMSMDDFFRALAEAIGAKLSKQKERYEIQFDPAVFRRRMVARLDTQIGTAKRANPNSYETKNLVFQQETYKAATNQDLEKAFAKQGSVAYILIHPRTTLWNALLARLDGYAKRTVAPPKDTEGWKAPNELVDMIDFDRPIYARLTSWNVIAMTAFVKGQASAGITF